MLARSADLRGRGAPSFTRRAHVYKDFLTHAKDFAEKEGHVWKMKTSFLVDSSLGDFLNASPKYDNVFSAVI